MAEELAKPEVDDMIAQKLGEVAAVGDASEWSHSLAVQAHRS